MATKTCEVCKKQCGPRTLRCECGHVFKTTGLSVAASSDKMSSTLKELSETVTSTRTLLTKIEKRKTFAVPESWDDTPEEENKEKAEATATEVIGRVALKTSKSNVNLMVTYAPAGECPFRPEGFKSITWPNGPASDQTVENWAIKVYNSGLTERHRYHPHAIVYWARYFWEMGIGQSPHAKEWSRIRDLILKVLSPDGLDHNSEDEV